MQQANPVNDQPIRGLWRKNLLIAGVLSLLSQAACSPSYGSKSVEETALPTASILETPTSAPTSVPTPTQAVYDWAGTLLYLETPLPENPVEAMVYQLQPENPATIERARALAQQFGMNGDMYEIPPEINFTGKNAFLVVDGTQQLRLNSDLDFWYYPDYERYRHQITDNGTGQSLSQENADRLVAQFLRSHGFDFAYDVKAGHFYDDYEAILLTPNGFTLRHATFRSPGFSFRFDGDDILSVTASLLEYAPVGSFGIISPEIALQRVTDHNTIYGVYIFTNSGNPPIRNWQRSYPENETVTVWGPVSSVNSVDGKEPLVTFDGYQVTGNIKGLADDPPSTFIEATGQIRDVHGVKTFHMETWQVRNINTATWLPGDIQLDGDQIIFTDADGLKLVLPDIPSDLPLPFENAFVRGIIHGNVFEWKYIDDHLQSDKSQGGGGFTSQFHKLNLTGTPVPLPTPVRNQTNAAAEVRTNYTGQTGVIELAELAYYVPNPDMFLPMEATTEPVYIQPVWRFYGHLSGGDEFEIIIQGLKDEFLSPELEAIEP